MLPAAFRLQAGVANPASGNTINSVRFAATGNMAGHWQRRAILRTRDGGFEWDAQLSPANTTYMTLREVQGAAIISGARGVIMTDREWRQQVGDTSHGDKRSLVWI